MDLLFASSLLDTYIARVNAADAISFALANQKTYYDRKHQSFVMKVGNEAMLSFQKGYSIFSSAEITKKLTQQ